MGCCGLLRFWGVDEVSSMYLLVLELLLCVCAPLL
jgi:hypothetical protein